MKLYYHPVSTTSRPIMLLAADAGIELDYQVVDLFTGAHLQPDYAAINPCCQVPVLEDGAFRLTESTAILRYLADQAGSPAYPRDAKARARVDERIDWFNTGLYRDLGYGLIYPQVLPNYARSDARVQAGTLEWGRVKARRWLDILDRHLIGDQAYLCGDGVTIADYLGVSMLTLGEVVHLDYSPWPNVARWIATMKSGRNWERVNEGFYAWFVAPFRERAFAGLEPAPSNALHRLHHNAYRCRDSGETRRFYEDFLGLRLAGTLEIGATKTGRATQTLHTFYELGDRSYLAFFEAPDMPFEFKPQHDFDLHIALEVDHDHLARMLERGRAAGMETRGPSDHGFIDSIYFRDPNGYVIELTARKAGHDEAMDPARNGARAKLDRWQAARVAR